MKQLKLFTLFIIILLNSNLLKAQLDSGAYSIELVETKTELNKTPNKVYSCTNEIVGNYEVIKTEDSYKQIVTFNNGIEVETQALEHTYVLPDSIILVMGHTKDYWETYKLGEKKMQDSMFFNFKYYEKVHKPDFKNYFIYFYNTQGKVVNYHSIPTISCYLDWDLTDNGELLFGALYAKSSSDNTNKSHIFLYSNKGEILWEKETIENIWVSRISISSDANFIAYTLYDITDNCHNTYILNNKFENVFTINCRVNANEYSFNSTDEYFFFHNGETIDIYNVENWNLKGTISGRFINYQNIDIIPNTNYCIYIPYKIEDKTTTLYIKDYTKDKDIYFQTFDIKINYNNRFIQKVQNLQLENDNILLYSKEGIYNFKLNKKQ